jgi:hypothetical protein
MNLEFKTFLEDRKSSLKEQFQGAAGRNVTLADQIDEITKLLEEYEIIEEAFTDRKGNHMLSLILNQGGAVTFGQLGITITGEDPEENPQHWEIETLEEREITYEPTSKKEKMLQDLDNFLIESDTTLRIAKY